MSGNQALQIACAIAARFRISAANIPKHLARDLQNSPAWHLLRSWLNHEPGDEVLTAWKDYARANVESVGKERMTLLRHELRQRPREVAEAAGSAFGFHPVSQAEDMMLKQIDQIAIRPTTMAGPAQCSH